MSRNSWTSSLTLLVTSGALCLLPVHVGTANPAHSSSPQRYATKNTLVSESLPQIRVRVDDSFRYVGRFDFEIRDVAAGERFIFAHTQDRKVMRLFIAQFEGFLPGIDDFYQYNFAEAGEMGGHRFRQNTYAYSNQAARLENPSDEAVLTAAFLRERGLELEDELMMSRFITVPDAEKRHELILSYVENVSSTGHMLSDFVISGSTTPLWSDISKELTARSLESFVVE